jgi:acyl dehydratase
LKPVTNSAMTSLRRFGSPAADGLGTGAAAPGCWASAGPAAASKVAAPAPRNSRRSTVLDSFSMECFLR